MSDNKPFASLSPQFLSRSGGGTRLFGPDPLRTIAWQRDEAQTRGLYGFESRDINSRPFNLLRSRLLKKIEQNGWNSIGIVSAAPGAGKSFVSSNLAAALSRGSGKEVYLIDFDLRRPTIYRSFGISEQPGLTDFLEGSEQDLRNVAGRLEGENLTIFPTFPSNPASAELLRSDPAETLFAWLRTLPPTSLVICDLPPAFANDDAAIVAEKLDAYLLVVEEGRTTKKQVKDAMQTLNPTPIAGVVLNRYVGGIFSDDYGYAYLSSSNYGGYYS